VKTARASAATGTKETTNNRRAFATPGRSRSPRTRRLPALAFFATCAFLAETSSLRFESLRLAGGGAALAADREQANPGYTYTVAPFVPEYDPPPPGSYELPVIDEVSDHVLLDSTGTERHLFELKKDRLAVVALIYTSCAEASGCPLASAVLQRLDRQLAADVALAGRVRLISLSFDPERDTPERLARVRSLHAPRTDWIFLTTPNEQALRPILADLGQEVARLHREDGSWSGLFRHVLKVYLLDEQNRVRNIYSTGFLDAGLVVADLRTLILERQAAQPAHD
jgi:cytochrome oxidase Cu insertion factor (SCO1/SenC/PrrC family)